MTVSPEVQAARDKLKAKFENVRTGGKGTARSCWRQLWSRSQRGPEASRSSWAISTHRAGHSWPGFLMTASLERPVLAGRRSHPRKLPNSCRELWRRLAVSAGLVATPRCPCRLSSWTAAGRCGLVPWRIWLNLAVVGHRRGASMAIAAFLTRKAGVGPEAVGVGGAAP